MLLSSSSLQLLPFRPSIYRLHFLYYALPVTATLWDTFSGGVVDGAHRGGPPFVYHLVAQLHLPVSGSHHFAHAVVVTLVVNVPVFAGV